MLVTVSSSVMTSFVKFLSQFSVERTPESAAIMLFLIIIFCILVRSFHLSFIVKPNTLILLLIIFLELDCGVILSFATF